MQVMETITVRGKVVAGILTRNYFNYKDLVAAIDARLVRAYGRFMQIGGPMTFYV